MPKSEPPKSKLLLVRFLAGSDFKRPGLNFYTKSAKIRMHSDFKNSEVVGNPNVLTHSGLLTFHFWTSENDRNPNKIVPSFRCFTNTEPSGNGPKFDHPKSKRYRISDIHCI